MPYDKISDAPPQIRSLASRPGGKNKIDLTLGQINEIARMYDGLKDTEGIESPMAIAITNFRRMYKVEDGKWVRRKDDEKMAEFDEIDDLMSDANLEEVEEGSTGAQKEELAETFELNDFPFFKSGKHNGKAYSESDLDRIVSNFYSLRGIVKPVLKLGHGGQKFLKDEGLPSIGWIESIKKKAGVLYADIKNIPKRIYELLKNKAYQRPSAEIYLDFQDDKGQKYGLTLSAIALLGADIPAIKSLPDIEALFNNEDVNSLITVYNENYERNKEGGLIMADEVIGTPEPTDELKKLKAELEEKTNELDAHAKEIQTKAEQIAKLEEDAAARKEAEKAEMIKSTLAKYKEEGKVLPVQEGALAVLLGSFTDEAILKYSDNGDELEGKQSELLFKVLDLMPNIVEFSELSEKREGGNKNDREKQYRKAFLSKDEKLELAEVEVSELAEKIAEEQKVSYAEALIIASEQLEQ